MRFLGRGELSLQLQCGPHPPPNYDPSWCINTDTSTGTANWRAQQTEEVSFSNVGTKTNFVLHNCFPVDFPTWIYTTYLPGTRPVQSFCSELTRQLIQAHSIKVIAWDPGSFSSSEGFVNISLPPVASSNPAKANQQTYTHTRALLAPLRFGNMSAIISRS